VLLEITRACPFDEIGHDLSTWGTYYISR
jgi:hypothetical protein